MAEKKKTKRIGTAIILAVIAAIVVWIAVAVIVGFLTSGGTAFVFFPVLAAGLADYRVWILWAAAIVAVTVMLVLRNTYSARRVLKVNAGEDSHWLSDAEIRNSDNMTITSYSRINNVKDGIPVYAKKQGRDITVVMVKPIHTLVIGTTGSGKTSGFVDPIVQVLCRTKTKPGMVITDPKGELFRSHAATLQAQGYSVLVLDLADPYHSARWNPFYDVIMKTRQLNSASIEQIQGKYVVDGKTFLTYTDAETNLAVFRQQVADEIFVDLQDIIYTLCPLESSQDPSWQQGARGFIFAIAVAMWEDLRDGLCAENEFNLFSLYKNVTDYAKGECEVLKEYFSGRERFSKAPGLANTVLVATDRTLTSYLSEVNGYMTWLADSGICALTAENDVELSRFDDAPTALFLKIPDEKENRHRIVTLMITQMYKILVGKARQNYKFGVTKDEELQRNVYIIMDEFGNMPKFQSIDRIITVGRGRHIFMIPIIQDYAQLDNKYGKDIAALIRSNCNIKVFIGSTDKNTINEFSEICGKTKQRHISFSDQTADRMSVSTSAESKPLIYPSELETLNDPPQRMGNAIVLAYGKNPFRSTFTPVFKAREIYRPETGMIDVSRPAEVFDEEGHFYDFYSRNGFIKMQSESQEEQRRLVDSLVAGDEEEHKEGSDAFTIYANVLQSRINGFTDNIPHEIADNLGAAIENHDTEGFLSLCDEVMDYAMDRGDRITLASVAKLKVLSQNLLKEENRETQ